MNRLPDFPQQSSIPCFLRETQFFLNRVVGNNFKLISHALLPRQFQTKASYHMFLVQVKFSSNGKQSKGHTEAHTAKQDLDFFCPSGCWSPKVGPGFYSELRRRIAGCGACPAQFHGLRNEKDSFALFLEISLLSSKRGKPSHMVVRFLVIAVASNQHGRSRPNLCLRLFCKWDKIVKIKREKTDTQALRNVLCCRALYRLI